MISTLRCYKGMVQDNLLRHPELQHDIVVHFGLTLGTLSGLLKYHTKSDNKHLSVCYNSTKNPEAKSVCSYRLILGALSLVLEFP